MNKAIFFIVLILSVSWTSMATKPLRQGSNQKGKQILVLLDDMSLQQTHSIYFNSLVERGYELTFKRADDSTLSLSEFGEYKYGALIIFAPTIEDFGGLLDVPSIVEFVDSGRNAIIAGSPSLSDPIRELASECGVDFDDDNSYVLDHQNYDASDEDGDHSLVIADDILENAMIVGPKPENPILFQGIGHTANENSKLLVPLVRGSGSCYSANPEEGLSDLPKATGKKTLLVSALQTRNNARVLVSGSIDMFSDRFMTMSVQRVGQEGKSGSGNQGFLDQVTKWTLGERGVLRTSNVYHHREEDQSKPKFYRVKDKIEFGIKIEELQESGEWQAFKADDVQVEFVMIDPYVRTFLQHDGKGEYSAKIHVPDVYGVFKFRIEHQRVGYSFLHLEVLAPVRPYRHDEYERWIVSAYPYYTSAFSMMAGFALFSFIFLFTKEKKE